MNPTDIRLGIYEHYKSKPKDRRLYQVISVAQHTERDELLIIYCPLYTIGEYRSSWLIRARPAAEFFGEIEKNGRKQPRYKFLGDSF